MLRLASSAATGALFGAVIPITALLLLAPAEYGHFSIVYLVFAFGVSLQYSIISEAWARRGRTGSWASYAGILVPLSALVAVAAAIVALLIPDLTIAAPLLGGAVLAALVRNGARYFQVAEGALVRVVVADLAGVAAFIGVLFALFESPPLLRVAAAWFACVLVASLLTQLPRFAAGSGPIAWLRGHRTEIRPLLLDSLLMDAGALGTPFLLAGFMGASRFGIYRAVSNASLPVRLIVDPLRPALGRMPLRRFFSVRVTLAVAAVTTALAVGCYVALAVILPILDITLGTLSSLVPFAVPTAVFVIGSFLGTVYYILCRTNATQREILIGRVAQTVLVVALPIGGFIAWGLTGAIWGFGISSVLSAVVWIALALGCSRRTPVD